ncbi:Lysophosphatidic acid phosphatase type 6 [Durusdinium trenchii]|uniref:Lysophosphatidic acid phosphatase type 6 n=1 Tax=Durusdinium trenchii TaxID=1381693 RepID=A0ABP0I282_9DINO
MVGAMQFFVSVTLLGMRTLAVEKLTFKEALQQPFEGYCAEAPDAQRSGFPEPPPVHLLRESNLQLRGVQLVFRHGARDLSSDKPCFKPLRRAFKNCSVQTLVSFTGLAPSDPEPLVREVLDAFPLREADLPGSGYTSGLEGCGLGVLLDDAIPQTKALATELRRQYFHRFSEPPSMNTTRLYSTGKLRTEATLFLMHRELFGDVPGARLFSRPVSSDPWDMNQHCPRAGHARHARHYKTSQALIEKRFPAFAKQWRLAAGTDFQAGFHDCLLVAKCSKQLELPEKLEPESSLFTEALRVSLLLFQEHYMHDPEALHLLAAPALVELEDFILRQAGNSMPLALWATHDATILVLLAALGLWNGQWPPYTDTLLIEVYVKTGEIPMEPAAFFRFLHHGHPVTFPWCETYFPELPGLCDVKSFLPPWIAPFRDLRRLRDACYTRVERGTEASVELQELGGSAGNIAVKVLFGAFLLLLGYSWREISELTLRTRKLASARTALLQ